MRTRFVLAGACAIGFAVAPAKARVVAIHGFHGPAFHPGFAFRPGFPYRPGFRPYYPGPRVFFGFGVAPVVPYYPYSPYPYAYYPPPPPYPYYYPYGAY